MTENTELPTRAFELSGDCAPARRPREAGGRQQATACLEAPGASFLVKTLSSDGIIIIILLTVVSGMADGSFLSFHKGTRNQGNCTPTRSNSYGY